MTNRSPRCCTTCFGDPGLERVIRGLSNDRGLCTYCGTTDAELIEPSKLKELFGPLVNIYEQSSDKGRLLVEWLRDDWDLFHHPRMDVTHAKDLLAEVLNDGEIVRKLFIPSPKYQSDRLDQWERLRSELMHENRYFPDVKLDLERLEELLDYLKAERPLTKWLLSPPKFRTEPPGLNTLR